MERRSEVSLVAILLGEFDKVDASLVLLIDVHVGGLGWRIVDLHAHLDGLGLLRGNHLLDLVGSVCDALGDLELRLRDASLDKLEVEVDLVFVLLLLDFNLLLAEVGDKCLLDDVRGQLTEETSLIVADSLVQVDWLERQLFA